MRKLSKRVRQQRAKADAEAHVRKHGLADLNDWAYSIAFQWGFEEDEPMIEWLAAFMRTIPDKMKAEEAERSKERKALFKKRSEMLQPVQSDDWLKRFNSDS